MNDDDLTIYLATPLDVTLDLQRDLSGMALTFRQHADADDGAEVLTKGLTIGSPASAGLVAETLYRYRVTAAAVRVRVSPRAVAGQGDGADRDVPDLDGALTRPTQSVSIQGIR
jgi:hypothetical protein